MVWQPPDAYASFLLSVGGGILAGIAVVTVEWVWRFGLASWQKKKAVRVLSALWGEWEESINSATGLTDPQVGIKASREVLQFAKHKYYIWTVPIVLSRWARHIPEQYVEDLSRLVTSHQNAVVAILPPGKVMSQGLYDLFFRQAREVKWLKF